MPIHSGIRRWKSALLRLLFCLAAAPASGHEAEPQLTLGTPGVATVPANRLLLSVEVGNAGGEVAHALRIDTIAVEQVAGAATLPLKLGDLAPGSRARIDASFDTSALMAGQSYALVLKGSYRGDDDDHDEDAGHEGGGRARDDEHVRSQRDEHDAREHDGHERDGREGSEHQEPRHPFTLTGSLSLPPAAPGQAGLGSVSVAPSGVSHPGYPAVPPSMDNDVNSDAPPVPTLPYVPGTPTPTGTFITPAPIGDPPQVLFTVNKGLGLTGAGQGCSGDSAAACAEPSGGVSAAGVVFITSNWTDTFSTDGGGTFATLNPTTIFPADSIGFCCDQIVQYAARVDRFIWLLQGSNGYRLAVASPAGIKSSSATSWTYWNLPPTLFGQPAGTAFDYPDLSIGDQFLYLSWDAGVGSNGCPKGCTSGFQVARISLAGLQAGGTVTIEFTDPANGPSGITWGDHVSQNTGDEVFWAGHNGNTQLRVFNLPENSSTYSWRDVGIASWDNTTLSSPTKDGQDWLAKNNSFPGFGVIGATRSSSQLWLAWSAGTSGGGGFQQPHVEMVALDILNNFSKLQQMQVWNNSYAFAYPALATNACTGEIGMSFEYGGANDYENHVVGFWGDFIAYVTTNSSVGTDRFGDYVSIRQAQATSDNPGNLFAAFGFGVNAATPPATTPTTDVHLVEFGRPAGACQVLR